MKTLDTMDYEEILDSVSVKQDDAVDQYDPPRWIRKPSVLMVRDLVANERLDERRKIKAELELLIEQIATPEAKGVLRYFVTTHNIFKDL